MLDGFEDRQRLPGKRDAVDAAHLGLMRWDRPKRLVEIEVGPFRIAKLAGTDKHMRKQLQRRLGVRKRSEEHTSELQSLIRTSYAVFCLKKKKKKRQTTT